MEFEWDPEKNRSNAEKHGVTFEEAITIFSGRYVVTDKDRRYDYGEQRYVSLGELYIRKKPYIVSVVHTPRNNRIRIISARRANRKERVHYYERVRKRET